MSDSTSPRDCEAPEDYHDYQITLKRDDLDDADWESLDANPLAIAIGRVLAPGAKLDVDVREDEYLIENDGHSYRFRLPQQLSDEAFRAEYDGTPDPPDDVVFTFPLRLPIWALP